MLLLYPRPPIAWSIDKAADFHDFSDDAVEDKIIPDSNAIVSNSGRYSSVYSSPSIDNLPCMAKHLCVRQPF